MFGVLACISRLSMVMSSMMGAFLCSGKSPGRRSGCVVGIAQYANICSAPLRCTTVMRTVAPFIISGAIGTRALGIVSESSTAAGLSSHSGAFFHCAAVMRAGSALPLMTLLFAKLTEPLPKPAAPERRSYPIREHLGFSSEPCVNTRLIGRPRCVEAARQHITTILIKTLR